MAISWGSAISKNHGYYTASLKLGYEASTSGQTTTVKIYVWTKYAVQDTSNTFIVDFCGTNGKYKGSIGINTSANEELLLWTGTTTNQTWSVNASLTGVDEVGSSNKAWLLTGDNTGKGSGTAWSSIGTPGAISIKQNSDLSITISGKWPTNGTNNPVKYCDLYYKWNSSTVVWNNSDKYIKIEKADSNGNYSYKIPVSDVLNGTHTSIAVRVYGICTYGNNTYTDIKTSTVVQGGIITKVPWRYYFSDSSNDGFKEDFSDNYIEWTKNAGEVFKVIIYQPNVKRREIIYEGEGNIVKDSNGNDTGRRKIDLNKNKEARREALSCMANPDCGYYYYNSYNPSTQYPYPSAKFYDSTLILESYKNNKTDLISSSEETMRIELSCPRTIPSNFKISPIEEDDFSYGSNNFKVTWNPVDWANQYIIRYALESLTTKNSWYQCKEDVVVKGDETIEGHDITSYIVSIPSALAGQKIRFTLKSRWHGEADGLSYDYDGPETSSVEIQKQGGMVTYINNKYQNCHVCVVDNNGKLVKALAAYVYAYKDGSTTEKEWRLIKMNS